MRKTITALVVLAMLSVAASAWAKNPNKVKDPNKVGRRHGRGAVETPPPPAPAPVELKGTIVKAEATEITLFVSLPVDANTKVIAGTEIKAVTDLKPGQPASITLESGKVTKIEATDAKEPPPAK